MLLPALQRAREQARRTVCLSNLRQCALSLANYGVDQTGCTPIYNNSPWDFGYGGQIPVSQRSGALYAGLGILYQWHYMRDNKIALCPSEVSWQISRWGQPAWWGACTVDNQHVRGWQPTMGRWNSAFIYRWSAPNPYGAVRPWWPNLQSVDGQKYAMSTGRDPKFANKGIMCDNVMSWGLSAANAKGTVHPGGGNALYYDGHARFVNELRNPYNPGSGPMGYYLGIWIFYDWIDDK